MGVVKLLAFVLILFGINAVNANNKFPNNHKMDLGTFVSAAVGTSEYVWKTMWEFTNNDDSAIKASFGNEYRFELSSTKLIRHERTIDLDTDVCSENTETDPHWHHSSSTFWKGPVSDEYLSFFSTNPAVYLWMYECTPWDDQIYACPTNKTNIKLLYNQGSTYTRPEGIPWHRVLKDLYGSLKLTLDDVRGAWRAAYKYKAINDRRFVSLLLGNHIVGFPTRRLKCVYEDIIKIDSSASKFVMRLLKDEKWRG